MKGREGAKMIFRKSNIEDLSKLYDMYAKIVEKVQSNNLCMWNQYYPSMCLEDDVKEKRLYLLEENDEIMAACAVSPLNEAENKIEWKDPLAKALYVERLGVNVDYQRRGIASLLVKNVEQFAKENEYGYVRLFVVNQNEPARKLYEKNGFQKIEGLYKHCVTEETTLLEQAYELTLDK